MFVDLLSEAGDMCNSHNWQNCSPKINCHALSLQRSCGFVGVSSAQTRCLKSKCSRQTLKLVASCSSIVSQHGSRNSFSKKGSATEKEGRSAKKLWRVTLLVQQTGQLSLQFDLQRTLKLTIWARKNFLRLWSYKRLKKLENWLLTAPNIAGFEILESEWGIQIMLIPAYSG